VLLLEINQPRSLFLFFIDFVGALKLPDTLERKHCHSLNQCLGWIQVLPAGYGTDQCVASIHGPTNFCSFLIFVAEESLSNGANAWVV
jgi:hypothetical protein